MRRRPPSVASFARAARGTAPALCGHEPFRAPGPVTELPVPRALLRRLWLALLGVAAFIAVALVQAAVRPGFDVWHQAVSALSLGSLGWVQDLNFTFLGLVLLSTVPVWRRILRGGKGATAYPALTALAGGSFIALAFLPQDPAPGYDPEQLALTAPSAMGLLHLAVAGVAAAASVAALFVMASRLAGDPAWPGWPEYTRAIALLTAVCIVVYAVWSTRPSGFAGTFERLAIILPAVWAFTFLRRLRAGAPLVKRAAAADGAPDGAGRATRFDAPAP